MNASYATLTQSLNAIVIDDGFVLLTYAFISANSACCHHCSILIPFLSIFPLFLCVIWYEFVCTSVCLWHFYHHFSFPFAILHIPVKFNFPAFFNSACTHVSLFTLWLLSFSCWFFLLQAFLSFCSSFFFQSFLLALSSLLHIQLFF